MADRGEHNPSVLLAGEITPAGHRSWARVYFADTDFSGVVYHARYLEFLERGRSDFLRLAGVHHSELDARAPEARIAWVVRRMDIRFRRPARIDDILLIETRTVALGGASITMAQRLSCDDAVLVEADVQAAIIGADGRPRRFPREWAEAFAPHPEW